MDNNEQCKVKFDVQSEKFNISILMLPSLYVVDIIPKNNNINHNTTTTTTTNNNNNNNNNNNGSSSNIELYAYV
ncbi:unnamed protein product [Trichobilharzia szidati]|nr:unnamed protein product [Trichobilharzia szidati]